MKKLICCLLCMILVLAALGFAGCARSADESAGFAQHYGGRDFELPLAGGNMGTWAQRQTAANMTAMPVGAVEEAVEWIAADSAPAPASAPPMVDDAMPYHGADQVGWEDIAGQGLRHVIQTANAELETEYFDVVVAELRQLAPAAGGYIESEMLTNHGWRMFSIVLRVPAASFETVLQQVEALAQVRHLNQWAQDVTDQFYDMVGSLEIRRIEEDRILALIEEADTIQELLALEQRLSNTRLSIEMYLSQLNNMAGQIAYSTIAVTLTDIAEEERVVLTSTLGERIGGAFGDSVDDTVSVAQNFIVFLAGALIPLMLLTLVGAAVYLVARKVLRKKVNAGHG